MRNVIQEFVAHYLSERYHQGVDSKLICPVAQASNDSRASTVIGCRSRLGGLLNYYHREAARLAAMSFWTVRDLKGDTNLQEQRMTAHRYMGSRPQIHNDRGDFLVRL